MKTVSKIMVGGALAKMAVLGVLLVAPAFAADKVDGTLLDLSSSAHKSVVQDRVTMTLTVEKQGKTAEVVQKDINTAMQAAKAIYDKVDGVKVSTGGYNVWQSVEPVMTKEGAPSGKTVSTWRGNQQVVLDAPAGDKVLKLAADLQKAGLAMQGMNYYLSREATDKLSDQLMVEALGTIRARAETLGKALNMPNVAFEEISSGDAGGGYSPRPMMAMAMKSMDAAEAMPVPVGKAGETEVNVTVNAKVRLTK